jgi:sialic acid synthase SpsE
LKNITCKRPGLGILANNYLKLIGKKVNKKMFKDQLVLSKDLY